MIHVWMFLLGAVLISCKKKESPGAADRPKVPASPTVDPITGISGVTVPTKADFDAEILGCELRSQPAEKKIADFKGKKIQYFNADQIDYSADDWWLKGDDKWISYNGFDVKDIGYPGREGNREFAPPGGGVNVRMAAIDVRNIEGKLHYHYFSNGTGRSNIENWSSTKGIAMLMAAHEIRRTTGGKAGLESKAYRSKTQPQSSSWIGDHIAELALNSTNPRAAWFKSIVGAPESDNFARNWLSVNTQYGSSFGEAAENIGSFVRANDSGEFFDLPRVRRSWGSVTPNSIMPIAMAEFWKRVTLNSQEPQTWIKKADYGGEFVDSAARRKSVFFNTAPEFFINEEDLRVLLYGSNRAKLKVGMRQTDGDDPSLQDSTVAAFGGTEELMRISGGRYRIFGKLGYGEGTSGARAGVQEQIMGGAICIPSHPNNAKLSGIKSGRLVAFFINVQNVQIVDLESNEDTVDRVITNMAKVLLHRDEKIPFNAATMLIP